MNAAPNNGNGAGGFQAQGQASSAGSGGRTATDLLPTQPFDQFNNAQSPANNFGLANVGNPYALQQQMLTLQRRQQQQLQLQHQQQQQRSASIASTDAGSAVPLNAADNHQQQQMTQNQLLNHQMAMFQNAGISGATSDAQAAQIRQRLAQALAQQGFLAQQQQQQQQGGMQGQGQGQIQRSLTPSQQQGQAQGMGYWNVPDGLGTTTQHHNQPQQQQQHPGNVPGSAPFPQGMDRQWIQQSLRAQHAQQASLQAQALAQARAGAGTPAGTTTTTTTTGGGGSNPTSARSSYSAVLLPPQQQQQGQEAGAGLNMGPPQHAVGGFAPQGNNSFQGIGGGGAAGSGGGGMAWNQAAIAQFQQQQQQQQQQGFQQQHLQTTPSILQTPAPAPSSAPTALQSAVTPSSVSRMSVPPARPGSAASQHSQFSTTTAAQQGGGASQGTPTPSLPKHTLGPGAGQGMGMGGQQNMAAAMGMGMGMQGQGGGQGQNMGMMQGMMQGMGGIPMALQMQMNRQQQQQQQQQQLFQQFAAQQQQQQGSASLQGLQQLGSATNVGVGNLQTPAHGQMAQGGGQQQQSSPMFAQPMVPHQQHLGVPQQQQQQQQMGASQSQSSPGGLNIRFNPTITMGPPQPQRQPTPYAQQQQQQFQVSPAAIAGGSATPTTVTGKRKTPGGGGGDVSESREQSVLGDYQQGGSVPPSAVTDGRKDPAGGGGAGPGKPAKQPRKKKEKLSVAPTTTTTTTAAALKMPKLTKAQQRKVDENEARINAETTGSGSEKQGADGGSTLEQAARVTTPSRIATDSAPQLQPSPSSAQSQPAQPSFQPQQPPSHPQPNAGNDPSSQSAMNHPAAAMLAALQNQQWPFDPRLIMHVRSIQKNRPLLDAIRQRDPNMGGALTKAMDLVDSGKVSQETLTNMQKFTVALAYHQQQRMHQQRQQQAQQRQSQSSQPPLTPRSPTTGSQPPPTPGSQSGQPTLSHAMMSQGGPPQMQYPSQRRDSQSSVRQNQSEQINTRPPSGNSAMAPPPLAPLSIPGHAAADSVGQSPLHHLDNVNAQIPPPLPTTPASAARPAVFPPPPMEEWQKYLPTLPRMTSIAPLPPGIDEVDDPTFGGALPVLTDEQLYQYRAWLDKDVEYARTLEAERARSANMIAEWLDKDVRPAWWQMDARGERPKISERMSIVWPIEKVAARANKRPQKGRVRKSMAEYYTKAEVKAVAQVPERLVPIRLDIEITDTSDEHRRYRDTFLWNAADTAGKLDKFVDTICEDFQIRPEKYKEKIRTAIEDQIKQGEFLLTLPGDDEPPGLSQEDYEWWKSQRLATTNGGQDTPDLIEEEVTEDNDLEDDMEERPETVDALMADLQEQNPSEDLRIKIQLDIVSGAMHLSDSFEWELTSTVTPEEFAEVYASDLGLNGEFKTAIAHDIREQVYMYMKSLAMLGYTFDGAAVSDIELRQEFLPPVTDVVRRDEQSIAHHTPFLVNITDADMERLETEREKSITKRKRATRGRRGVILPDREPIRTVRMRIGGEVDENGRPLGRLSGPKQPFVFKPTASKKPTTSRRAAALAARANISEMSNDVHDERYDAVVASSNNVRLKRNRPSTMTPGPQQDESNGSVRASNRISERLVPKEERMSVSLEAASGKTASDGNESRPDSVRQSATEQVEKPQVSSKDGSVKPRSRDDSPAPFPDVASPESTSSSSADGVFSLGRSKSQAKRSLKNDRKIQTPLVQSSKPLPNSTPETSKARSSTGRVSESPAKTTPVLSTPGVPSIRPPAQRVASHQPAEPAWLSQLLGNLKAERPRERVQATWKGPPANPPPGTIITEVDHWRIKCLDCQGKIYSLGPGETLQNFEKHLRNKQHLANVDARINSSKPA